LAAGILLVAAAPGHAQTVGGCPVFPTNNIWNVRVDTLPVHPQSAAWVQSIGPNSWLHQDFGGELYNGLEPGMQVNLVTGSQPRVPIVVTDGADESDPGPYPIPPTAKVENGSDRHVIVVDTTDCRLYETFYSFKNADNSWTVYSAAIFDLRRNLLRPDYWTSADAAGLPILAGLARYEDIVAGELRHALRFTAPRTTRQFLWPARHYASYTADANLPPMGARFRLKANFDISPFSPTTQIILTGLKRYGMMLADNGGPWYVQGTWDPRWPNLGDEWWRIPGSAFEAVDVSGLMEDYDSAAVRGAVAAPILDSVSFAASPVTGGLPGATLRVSVMAAAPAGGAVVSLASSASAVASIAPSVTIPAGAASVNVPVTTNAVGASMPVVFTASLAGQARQATLTVNPAPASQAPAQQSVAPPSGSGEQVAFVVRTSDGDGAGDIARLGRRFARRLEGEFDIAERRQPREQRIALEHHAAIQSRIFDGRAVDHDGSLIVAFESRRDGEEGGLAAARGADEGHEFIVADIEIETLERDGFAAVGAEGLAETRDGKFRRHQRTAR